MYTKIEDLKVASALMYEGDFDRFIDKDKYEVEAEDTSEVDKKLEEDLAALESFDVVEAEFKRARYGRWFISIIYPVTFPWPGTCTVIDEVATQNIKSLEP